MGDAAAGQEGGRQEVRSWVYSFRVCAGYLETTGTVTSRTPRRALSVWRPQPVFTGHRGRVVGVRRQQRELRR